MSSASSSRLFRLLAISAVGVAMLTLIFGTLTTTKNAGMAFRDWPTSDGYFMITYPWLADFGKDWKKFLEHGHRLAAVLIGLWAIALVVAAFLTRETKTLKILSVCFLLGVICQGLIGGRRVQLDARDLALLHGAFAAIVISVISAMVLLTGRKWKTPEVESDRGTLNILTILSLLIVAVLATQYVFGGLIRHKGTGLHEHLGIGIAALALIFMNMVFSGNSSSTWLRRSALVLLLFTLGQVLLGAGAWVFKYGFTPTGFVAVSDSIQQVLLRTTHTIWGIVTFQAAVLHALRVFRVRAVSPRVNELDSLESLQLRSSGMKLASGGGS